MKTLLLPNGSLRSVEKRATTGRWPDTSPAALNAAAARLDPNATHTYLTYRPAPYPRPFDPAHQQEAQWI